MTEKTFETRCGTIHYWTNEFSSGRQTLVFLPGLTADHRLFDKQIEAFREEFNVLQSLDILRLHSVRERRRSLSFLQLQDPAPESL